MSPKLRRTLLKARGKDVNGPLVPSNPSHREGEPWEYMEKHVPLSLWKAIVKNFLRLRRQGIQPGHLQDVLPTMIPGRTGQRAPNLSDDDDDNDDGEDDDNDDDNDDGFGPYEEDKHDDDISTDISHPDERRGPPSRATERNEHRHEQRDRPSSTRASHAKHRTTDHHHSHHVSRATVSSQQKQHKVDPIKAQSRAYYSRLQRIPSRLGHVIREHRFHHHQQQIKHDRDALHTIGSRRVDILTAQAPKLGFADPAYHQQLDATQRQRNASLQRHGLLYQENPANQTTKLSLQAKSVEQRRLQRGAVRRLHQLDSGAATLEIADAFLQSNVGRELMRNSSRSGGAQYRDYYGEEDRDEDDEDEDADLSPKEAQARAAALLGLSSKTATDTRAKDTKSRKDIAASSSSSTARGTTTAINHNTATSSRLQEKVDHVAATKALYEGQSGWKATKGGWVADFGPAHTHPLYTGPDHYTPFLLDRKQDRELARSSAETDHSRGGQRRNGTHGHQATSDAKKMHRLDEADILFATSRPPASGGATTTTTTAHTASSSRHLNMHRHHRHFADAAEDEEYLNGDAEGDLGHDNDFLFLSEAAPTVLSPKPSATRSDRKATQAMQIEVESSPVSSDDAALYANATVGRSGVLDDSLDGPHDDNSEDDVDALMSRLQSSISLKDIASDNE